MSGTVADDVAGTEHKLPWDQLPDSAMEKGYNHAWSQIIADRGVRQRLAIFATRRLVETSTCGLPPGSVLVVSGVEAAQSPAGPPLHVVRIGEGLRQIESLWGLGFRV